MFEQIHDEEAKARISFRFEGQIINATPGMSVAAALLVNDVSTFRHSCSENEPRGPFCLMGACYECVVLINGESTQACMTPAKADIDVRRGRKHAFENNE